MPVPSEEQSILEQLVTIRNRLTALKKDDTDIIRPQDVLNIYQAVLKQVTKLNAVRDAAELVAQDGRNMPEPSSKSRVDTCLGDVFQLLSLFFLRIGRNRDAPATYCQLAIMKNLLDNINEGGSWTQQDLKPFSARLAELKTIIERGKDDPPALTRLLMRKWEYCHRMLDSLVKSLSVMSHELVPIHQKLTNLRRRLFRLAAQPKPSREEIREIQEELREIDGQRLDGKFLGPGGSSVPEGQAILSGLLEEGFEIAQDLEARQEEVSPALRPIYDRLIDARTALERLLLTHRWTLRETDLYNFQVSLNEIDRLRVDGKWVDENGDAPDGQSVCQYLLRRCYGLIYRLISSSEPVSEELMPIANKLSTVKRCLHEVYKAGGPFTPRDLYPYQLALLQIEGLRKDGKFEGPDGSIPEGQAILNAHLSEAHEIIQSLREEMERDQDA